MKDTIFGIHAVIEALKAQQPIDKIQINRELKADVTAEIKALAREQNIYVQAVPLEKINRITRKNHQGVIALMSPIEFHKIENLLPGLFEQGKIPFIMVLDGLTDVRNFGALVRTAECVGVDAIVIPDKGAARINSDAMKTSGGALTRVPICKAGILPGVIKFLQLSGLKVVGITEKAEESVFEQEFSEPLALVMGSEETGISNQILKRADHIAKIPMKGKIASLNVSVAAGVAMYEVSRQRMI
ncbi:MAG: 23S rRNA (guanosine(2251)-2'-O)-methyltransferase RlmB [Bacteroidota bacterium]|nr:23S rRNA (guanosine(2251)-2'-O)-methyltransferase RlmB [Bacteroidota bacterium]